MASVYAQTSKTKARVEAKNAGASKEQIRSIGAPETPDSGKPNSKAPTSTVTYSGSGKNISRPYTDPGVTDVSGGLNTESVDDTIKDAEGEASKDVEQEGASDFSPRIIYDESPSFQAETEEQIQRRLTKAAQSEINSLRQYRNNLLQEQAVINDKANRSTAARNTLQGLAGSSEADFAQQETAEKGRQANERIRSAVETQVQGILSQIRKDAVTEAREQRNEARLDEQSRLANEKVRRENAVESLKNLSAAGVTLKGLKSTDPKGFEYLAKQFGGEEALRGAFVLNTPQEQILDKQIKGGSYVIAKQNPITQKISIETIDLGLPPEYTSTIDAGDRILAIPENWDGDPSKLVSIAKGLSPSSANNVEPGDNPQLYGGLTSATATAVRARVNAYKSEKGITNFQTIQDGYNFATGMSNDTRNPADDQALIYALAKALDPDSVVREGEYATVQKYSQSWVDSYGNQVKNAIAGTGFLSNTARENIKSTIKQKYKSSKSSYDKVRDEYVKGINSLTGRQDGAAFLTDYQTAAPRSATIVDSEGRRYDASDLSDEEYDEAIDNGYVPE